MESTAFKQSMETSTVKVANPRTVKCSDFVLRFLLIVSSAVSITVLAVSKETETVPVTVLPNLPPIMVAAVAKWQYMPAFVYLMVANCIALVYGTLSTVLSMMNRGRSNGVALLLIVLDLVVMGLLVSATGASTAAGLLARHGNSHAQWKKICNVFGSSCNHVAASTLLALIGAIALFLLIIVSVVNLHKRSLIS